jgi:deazaflavin-dependent oxidoreductase (nitroreductase family)
VTCPAKNRVLLNRGAPAPKCPDGRDSGSPDNHTSMTAPSKLNPALRSLFRAPVALYRWRLGWLLGHRFLLVVHRGRCSAMLRRTVLEVLHFDPDLDEAVVIAGFGHQADWYRNVMRHPDVEIHIGRRQFPALARELPDDEAVAVLAAYERRHRHLAPLEKALISRLTGWHYSGTASQHRRLIHELPLVGFRSRDASGPEALEN